VPRRNAPGENHDLPLTATQVEDMYIRVKPVGRMRGITAIVMAYAILLILVSPLVPWPLTTMRSKQTVQPPHFVAPVSALLFTAAVDSTRTFWLMEEPERLLTRGSDIVDLTTARLC
ncbi:MAG TPA: hypothetical protein VF840_02590, partial [Terriglobales bacterium]